MPNEKIECFHVVTLTLTGFVCCSLFTTLYAAPAGMSAKDVGGQYLPLGAYYPATVDRHQQQAMTQRHHLAPKGVSQTSTVEQWLVHLKMPQYTSLFHSRGFALVRDLLGSTSESLELLGVSTAKHRKKMMASLNDVINSSTSQPTTASKKQSAVHIII